MLILLLTANLGISVLVVLVRDALGGVESAAIKREPSNVSWSERRKTAEGRTRQFAGDCLRATRLQELLFGSELEGASVMTRPEAVSPKRCSKAVLSRRVLRPPGNCGVELPWNGGAHGQPLMVIGGLCSDRLTLTLRQGARSRHELHDRPVGQTHR